MAQIEEFVHHSNWLCIVLYWLDGPINSNLEMVRRIPYIKSIN